jgi:hypothetical protein
MDNIRAMRKCKPVNPRRICPECSEHFIAHHGRMRFCTPAHQAAFHERNKTRGKMLLPFVLVWRGGRGGGGQGTSDEAKYAFAQVCALADIYNAEDRAAGRKPSLIVADRRRAGWAAADAAGR